MANSDKYLSRIKNDIQSREELLKYADAQWLVEDKVSLAHSGVIAITNHRFMWRGKREWTLKESTFDIPIKQIKGLFLESTPITQKLTLLDSIDQRRTFTSADSKDLLAAFNSALKSDLEAVDLVNKGELGLTEELSKLAQLKTSGLLSDEEFEEAKRKLLDK